MKNSKGVEICSPWTYKNCNWKQRFQFHFKKVVGPFIMLALMTELKAEYYLQAERKLWNTLNIISYPVSFQDESSSVISSTVYNSYCRRWSFHQHFFFNCLLQTESSNSVCHRCGVTGNISWWDHRFLSMRWLILGSAVIQDQWLFRISGFSGSGIIPDQWLVIMVCQQDTSNYQQCLCRYISFCFTHIQNVTWQLSVQSQHTRNPGSKLILLPSNSLRWATYLNWGGGESSNSLTHWKQTRKRDLNAGINISPSEPQKQSLSN